MAYLSLSQNISIFCHIYLKENPVLNLLSPGPFPSLSLIAVIDGLLGVRDTTWSHLCHLDFVASLVSSKETTFKRAAFYAGLPKLSWFGRALPALS